MNQEDLLRKLEGLHTVETVMEELSIGRQSALNRLSRLKKEQHLTVSGGGRVKRLYKITLRKQRPRVPGMWDILNRYNPHFKLNPWYDHQVHGRYTVEDALVDAIETKSFRIILATLRLFSHITDWPRLYKKAGEKSSWQKVGALYDVSRLFFKVRKMPERYRKEKYKKWQFLTQLHKKNFPVIGERWRIYLPFNRKDLYQLG